MVGAGRSVEDFETICTRRDGSTFPVRLTVTPIRDPDGTVIGASAIARAVYAGARDTTRHKLGPAYPSRLSQAPVPDDGTQDQPSITPLAASP